MKRFRIQRMKRILALQRPYEHSIYRKRTLRSAAVYDSRFKPGGCHVPVPTGKIDGGVVFGE